MKKLMITAAIVCAAALSQAATVSWQISGLKDATGKTALSGGYAYIYTNKGDNQVNMATLVATLSAADSVQAFQSALDDSGYLTAMSGAVTSGSQATGDLVPSESGLKTNQSGTKLFAIITDSETISADTKWYVTDYSNTAKVLADTAVGSTDFSVADIGSATASNWRAINVPEPTSGLMLLLGMAGLALRRRRA